MDRKNLISLLRESVAQVHERTPFCPNDHEIAAYVDGGHDEAAQSLIGRHLADCQSCINRIGLLSQLVHESDHGIEEQFAQVSARNWKQPASRWAMAASVLLAVGLAAWVYEPGLRSTIDPSADFLDTRNLTSRATAPKLLAPNSITIEDVDEFVFRWTEVPGSLYYDVRIVSGAGELISLQRIGATEWRIDRALHLEPGRDYFIRIDAYLADVRPISSEHLLFRLRE